jgi:hypothetical protein
MINMVGFFKLSRRVGVRCRSHFLVDFESFVHRGLIKVGYEGSLTWIRVQLPIYLGMRSPILSKWKASTPKSTPHA